MTTITFADQQNCGDVGIRTPDGHPLAGCETVEDVVDELAAAVMPPVRDCLVLADHLPPEACTALEPELGELLSYTWHSEVNFEKAVNWCLAAIATMDVSIPASFFVDPIVDRYHHDRALRAATQADKEPPLERHMIPKRVQKRRDGAFITYKLKEKPFAWSRSVPYQALDEAADFMKKTVANPPDALWIADYVAKSDHDDPIIYASFGPWQVEVARWD